MDLRFVTTNPAKLREVRALLAPLGVRVRWVRRKLPELQSDRLETVVRGKLRAAPVGRSPVLVEDSGFFLPALNGFPGVYSEYIRRVWGFGPILELLSGRPRSAEFRTVAGLRWNGKVHLFGGRVAGRVPPSARGTRGFGFDPLFEPDGASRTFAEMTLAEKNRYSHRARAIVAVGRFLTRARKPSRRRPSRRTRDQR